VKIDLYRRAPVGNATIGDLYVDGYFACYSLEDLVRDYKIGGETAIPAGTYQVTITWSPHFQRRLPLLNDVPNYEGVRIHPGNYATDTEGCILVGTQVAGASILNSRVAFDALFNRIETASMNNDIITITVHDAQLA